jgi:hypothetical protein
MAKPKWKRKPLVVTSNGREGKIYECAGGRFKAHYSHEGAIYQNMTATREAAREFLEGVFTKLDAEKAKSGGPKPIKIRIAAKGGLSVTIQCDEGQFRRTVRRELPAFSKKLSAIAKGLGEQGTDETREKIEVTDEVVFLEDFDPSFVPED